MSAYTEYLASTASAQAQMDFQERMSSTAHTREVADLKAAGLNPVLSAGGSGASTPSGAEGDYSAILPALLSTVNNTAKALGKGVKNLTKAQLVNAITTNNERDPDDLYSILNSTVHSGLKALINYSSFERNKPNETLDEYIRRKDKEALEKNPMLKHFVDFSNGLASTTKVGRNYVKYVSDPLHMMLSRLLHKKNYQKDYGINQTAKVKSKSNWKSKIKSWWNNTNKNTQMVYKYR